MYQYDDPTCVSSLPVPAGAGTPGYFTNGNPAGAQAATILTADFMNAVMLELLNVVTGAGITPSKTSQNQVLAAIKRIGQNTVVLADTGAANAYVAANSTPLVAGTWVDGVVQQIKIAHTNTGASTYAPDGLTAIPIYGLGLQPLQGGELFLGGTAVLMHATIAGVNSGNPICVLMECAGGAQQIAPATQSQHALTAGQIGAIGGQGSLPINTSAKLNGVNAANLLLNGSAEFGSAGWGSSNFVPFSPAQGSSGEGTYWYNNAAISSTTQDIASAIPVGAGVPLVLSAEISAAGVTAGRAYVYMEAFNSGGTSLGGFGSAVAQNGSGWARYSVAGTTPAGTASVVVHRAVDSSPSITAGGVAFRRIKLEQGTIPSLYSQEATIATIAGGMPVVGSARNVAMSVSAASATATLTADEIIVATTLGGAAYKLANFSKTVNLATTGAGGMDTGSAPVSGFVALYAIYNPTTGASALLATNATSTLAPSVYGGGSMPAGYATSALVSVWPTNASSQFAVGMQDDRKVWITPQTALSTSTQQSSLTSLSISSLVPKGAKRVAGNCVMGSSSATASVSAQVAGSSQGFGSQQLTAYTGFASQAYTVPFNDVPLLAAQTVYYSAVANTGTASLTISITAYTF